MKNYKSSTNARILRMYWAILVGATLLVAATTNTRAAVTNLTGGAFASLDFLIAGNQATVGDKVFSAFTFVANGDFPSDFGADDINVIGIQDEAGNLGIRFQGGISPNLGGSGDIFLTYTVAASGDLISDLHLAYNGSQISGIIEQAFVDGNPNPVAHLEVSNPPPVYHDMVVLATPVVQLQIEKDVFVRSLGGVTLISNIDQTFSQLPEPSTMTLVLGSLAWLVGVVRRRDRRFSRV